MPNVRNKNLSHTQIWHCIRQSFRVGYIRTQRVSYTNDYRNYVHRTHTDFRGNKDTTEK